MIEWLELGPVDLHTRLAAAAPFVTRGERLGWFGRQGDRPVRKPDYKSYFRILLKRQRALPLTSSHAAAPGH